MMFDLQAKVNGKIVFERSSDYQSAQAAMNFVQRWVKQNFPLEDVTSIEYKVTR